jgi:hypothetical protein
MDQNLAFFLLNIRPASPGPASPRFLPAVRREFVSVGPFVSILCKGWPGNLFVYLSIVLEVRHPYVYG